MLRPRGWFNCGLCLRASVASRFFLFLILGSVGLSALADPDFSLYTVTKGRRYEQTSSGRPRFLPENEYEFNAHVFLTATGSVTAATVESPAPNFTDHTMTPDGPLEFDFRDRDNSPETIETNYPSGNFRFRNNTKGEPTDTTVRVFLGGDTYPTTPRISNFDALQAASGTGYVVVTWFPFDGGESDDFIQLRIENLNGTRVYETSDFGEPGALDGTATYAIIEPGDLRPGRTYLATLEFRKTVTLGASTYPGATAWSYYFKRTQFTIRTTTDGPPDVRSYSVSRGLRFSQTNTAAPMPGVTNAQFEARVRGRTNEFGPFVTSASVTPPGRLPEPLGEDDCRRVGELVFNANGLVTNIEPLFTNGTYNLEVNTLHDGLRSLSLNLSGSSYPPTPHVRFDPNSRVAHDQDLVIQWDPWADGRITDFIQLRIEEEDNEFDCDTTFETGDFGDPDGLTGRATSTVIPAGTLQAGRSYTATLVFRRIVHLDATTYPGALGIAFYFSRTSFNLGTGGPDVSSYTLAKGQNFIKTNMAAPVLDGTNAFELNAEVEALDPGRILSSVLRTPSGSMFTMITNVDGETFEHRARFSTSSALESFYPTGEYLFDVQTLNNGLQTLSLNLPATAYPPVPNPNFDPSARISHTQNLVLQWTAWQGGTSNDLIQLRIQNRGQNVFRTGDFGEEDALPGTATSFVIPAGTLDFAETYSARLIFQRFVQRNTNVVGTLGEAWFFSETKFDIRTIGPEVDSYSVTKGQTFVQTNSSSAPFPDGTNTYTFTAELEADAPGLVLNSSVTVPGGATFQMVSNAAGDQFEYETNSVAPLETEYPPGTYTFNVQTLRDGAQTNTLNVPAAAYPPTPMLRNFDSAQRVAHDQNIIVEWDPWTTATTNDFIQLRIQDSGTNVFETGDFDDIDALPLSATSAVIPAGTLRPGETYSARLIFTRFVTIDETNYPGSLGTASYFTRTKFDIKTIGPPVASFTLEKGQQFIKTNTGPAVPDGTNAFVFNAQVEGLDPGAVFGSILQVPGGSSLTMTNPNGQDFEHSAAFASDSELEAVYPPGSYRFDVETTNGAQSLFLEFPPSAYPPMPEVLNFDPAIRVSHTQDLRMEWSAWINPGPNDFIQFRLRDSGTNVFETGDFGDADALPITATNVVIPAGTLRRGETYTARLIFTRFVTMTDTNGSEGLASYYSRTEFDIRTIRPDVVEYSITKGRTFTQTNTLAQGPVGDVPGYIFQAEVEGGSSNAITFATVRPPGTLTHTLRRSTNNPANFEHEPPPFLTEFQLNSAYRAGNYVFNVRATNDGLLSLVLNLPTNQFPPTPTFNRITPPVPFLAQSNTPTVELAWNAWPGATSNDFVQLRISDQGVTYFETPDFGDDGAFNGTSNSVIIPTTFFEPGKTYTARLTFRRFTDIVETNEQGSVGIVSFFTRTEMELSTVPPDTASYSLFKGSEHRQTNSGLPQLIQYRFLASVVAETNDTLLAPPSLILPNGMTNQLLTDDGVIFEINTLFASQAEVDAVYPDGKYTLTVNGTNYGTKTLDLFLTNSAYPAAPHIVNYAAAGEIPARSDFFLVWDPFTNGTPMDFIELNIRGRTGPALYVSPAYGAEGALDGTQNQGLIPSNTLSIASIYTARVRFEKLSLADDTTYVDVDGKVGYYAETSLPIVTAGPGNPPIIQTNSLMIRPADGRLRVVFSAIPGATYLTEGSSNFVDWLPVQTNIPTANLQTNFLRRPTPYFFYRTYFIRQ